MLDLLSFVLNHWILSIILLTLVALLFFLEKKYGAPMLSPNKLVRMLNDSEVEVVDIRDSKQFILGHIASSKNYPSTNTHLEDSLRAITKPIVLVCATGSTAKSVGKSLRHKGMDVSVLQGGISEWGSCNLPLVKK